MIIKFKIFEDNIKNWHAIIVELKDVEKMYLKLKENNVDFLAYSDSSVRNIIFMVYENDIFLQNLNIRTLKCNQDIINKLDKGVTKINDIEKFISEYNLKKDTKKYNL